MLELIRLWNSPGILLNTTTLIIDTLRRQIAGGCLAPGHKLPAERELAVLFDTTRITVKDALSMLEAEGLIYREERRGWFVSRPRLIYNPATRSHFHELVHSQQRTAETRVLACEAVVAPGELVAEMGLAPLSRLIRICRARRIDERTVLYVEHFLRPELFPGIEQQDLSRSLTELYRRKYGLEYGRSRFDICPTAARGEAAGVLNLAQGSPVLAVSRINYDQFDRVIDCDREVWRHDAVRIRVESRGEPRTILPSPACP
ncbi:putative transcriptional regulator of 2-aminoethylphosphonate degradation operon [Oceanimonas sp. MB9]|nr:putative transcriptional regulator of 2-aminoethylphosphonate degradation operon [Oceanimonas sp. MB9]